MVVLQQVHDSHVSTGRRGNTGVVGGSIDRLGLPHQQVIVEPTADRNMVQFDIFGTRVLFRSLQDLGLEGRFDFK